MCHWLSWRVYGAAHGMTEGRARELDDGNIAKSRVVAGVKRNESWLSNKPSAVDGPTKARQAFARSRPLPLSLPPPLSLLLTVLPLRWPILLSCPVLSCPT